MAGYVGTVYRKLISSVCTNWIPLIITQLIVSIELEWYMILRNHPSAESDLHD